MRKLAVVGIALALTACGLGDGSPAQSTTTAATSTTLSESTSTMAESDPVALPIVEPAKADLSRRLGIDSGEINVVATETVTWPDGSLGCPEPGFSYTQALVDGSKVLLEHGGRIYVYHAGSDDQPFLCPSDEKDGGYDFVPPPGFNE